MTTLRSGETAAIDDTGAASSVELLAAGRMLGRYELVERLGAGAMGVVWSARDPQLDRRVAIKLVHPELARSSDASSRLLREARAMAKLSHRAVVTVYDAGEAEGMLFLAMELVEGTTLGALLRARTPSELANWRRWLRMLIDAGRGLAAAHRGGVLHRDFKPDNVLVDRTGRVCVGDFGLATLGEAALAAASQTLQSDDAAITGLDLTRTGALLGTPVYMSPQQLRGEAIDARADQFSFCVAVHEALYGVRPFSVTNEGFDAIPALAEAIELGKLPDVARSEIPPAVREVLRRGLSGDPSARWSDIDTLLDALVRAARPRRTWPYFAAAGVAVAVAAVLVVAVRSGRDSEAPRVTTATLDRMFELPIRAQIAVSPDGRYLAVASDHLEVRNTQGSVLWTVPLGGHDEVIHVEFDGDSLRFGINGKGILRWRFKAGDAITSTLDPHGRWYGHSARGDVFFRPAPKPTLSIIDDGKEVASWTLGSDVHVFAMSPDRTRIAYLEVANRFEGRLVIRDLVRGTELHSGLLVDPTAVTWVDNASVIYSTETITLPTIHHVTVGPQGLGAPTTVYTSDVGWFGKFASGGGLTFALVNRPMSRTRIVGSTGNVRDLDASSVAAALAWISTDELFTWNRSSGRIERWSELHTTATSIALISEPANATLADDTLIVTTRRSGGRDTTAYAVKDGAQLWRHEGGTIVARCAADRRPPCFAVRMQGEHERIVTLDPATGELGTKVLREGMIEDIAVRSDGKRILVAEAGEIFELDSEGVQLEVFSVELGTTRSVAYDPKGDILVAGTLFRNTYQVGRIHGHAYAPIVQTESDILSLVRPDPEGIRASFLARVYAPEVVQLHFLR